VGFAVFLQSTLLNQMNRILQLGDNVISRSFGFRVGALWSFLFTLLVVVRGGLGVGVGALWSFFCFLRCC
jgi:hypothetical protein